jgi:hypothetical protein
VRLYAGMSAEFVRDTVRNQIADKLTDAFFGYYRYRPSVGEVGSWRNSLRAMALILETSRLRDQGVILEYQLPQNSRRLDCMLCGRSTESRDEAVIVELKQWEGCEACDIDDVVVTWVGGSHREVLHPSVQVRQYRDYLADGHSAFHEGDAPVGLGACSYLHNYSPQPDDPIHAPRFADTIAECPLFSANEVDGLSAFLRDRLADGGGRRVLDRIEQGKSRPSRKLMEYVATTIRERPPWILLDEQLVVFNKVVSTVRSGLPKGARKRVVLIHGGPGTGKSVIAINLLGHLARVGVNAHYATGSRAFTETLWNILGSQAKPMLRYFNNYGSSEPDGIDVLICDEAHRIRETSNHRFTPKSRRSTKPQLQEILDASKVSVFFLDDKQTVRPNEIGSSKYILEQAKQSGCEISEYRLEVQFRCAGSDGFIKWINNTLGVERTANVLWDGAEGFDFKIMDSVWDLDREIRAKASEGLSARVAAGFCWPWSEPRDDGTLLDDVVVGDYRRPWDAKPGTKKRLAPGIPTASLWATDPDGINQVGCVYNIQGFELDYVGVIWGPDLRYSFDHQTWVGDKKKSCDQVVKRSKERFVDLVKNTYRVLLSRGMKGCYVYFMDKDTERFVRTRMDDLPAALPKVAESEPPYTG